MKRRPIQEVAKMIGQAAMVAGWVNNRRDHGKIIFIDLRDRIGLVQVVFTPSTSSGQAPSQKELYELANSLRGEWVVCIKGTIKERPEKMINLEIPTGKIEIEPLKLEVLNESEALPFPV